MSRSHHLSNMLCFARSLSSPCLFMRMFLFRQLALVFLILKFINLVRGPNLGNVKVPHLLSTHKLQVLPLNWRLVTLVIQVASAAIFAFFAVRFAPFASFAVKQIAEPQSAQSGRKGPQRPTARARFPPPA